MRKLFYVLAIVMLWMPSVAHAQRCAALSYSWNGAWASQAWTGEYACENAKNISQNACYRNAGRTCGFMTTAFDCMAVAICNHWNGQRHAYGAFGATQAQAENNALGAVISAGWANCYVRVRWCPYGEFARQNGVE